MRWKWWLSPRNPRFVYMLAGSCFTSGAVCMIASALKQNWLTAIIGFFPIVIGVIMLNMQRRREESEGSEWAAYRNREFDRMCDEAMRAIASRINDDLEKAGHGRPVHVQQVSIH